MMEIIKASAGSGKTFALAGKYIRLLLAKRDRHAYRHILAVTFTNKATNEMNFVAQKFARQVLLSNNIDSCNRT